WRSWLVAYPVRCRVCCRARPPLRSRRVCLRLASSLHPSPSRGRTAAFLRSLTERAPAPGLDLLQSTTHPAAPSSTWRPFLGEGDEFARGAIDEGLKMLAPCHERGAHLVCVRTLVVDLGRAAAEAAIVAEDALDDVRLHIQVVGQVG